MTERNELNAIIQLLEDPDPEVYEVVSNKLVEYGTALVPSLLQVQYTSTSDLMQDRIDAIIHQIQLKTAIEQFKQWQSISNPSIIEGLMLVSAIVNVHFDKEATLQLFEQIRKSCWLELNHYLTALEKITTLNSVLFNHLHFKGELDMSKEEQLFNIEFVLQFKKGNMLSMGALYMALAQVLDLPVKLIKVEDHYLLAYVDTQISFLDPEQKPVESIQFFINPLLGDIYSMEEIEAFLKTQEVDFEKDNFPFHTNQSLLLHYTENMFQFYTYKEAYDLADLLKAFLNEVTLP
ncbi:MAG: hypothetical protein KGN97_02680 [Bacteroidota bacterium]|jgi:hypothetical protein|nr:hypothetical protein [Bacteroidota bacterium]